MVQRKKQTNTKNAKKIKEQRALTEQDKLLRLEKQKKQRIRNNRGNTNVARKFTFNQINSRIASMTNSSTLSIYTGKLVHFISKGWSKQDVPIRSIASNVFVHSSNKIYTQNAVKMPLVIIDFGPELPIGWLDDIRDSLSRLRNRYNNAKAMNLNLTLNRITINVPSDVSFSSSKHLINDYKNLVKSEDFDTRDEQLLTYSWLQSIEADDLDSLWETREFLELVVSGGNSSQTAELLQDGFDELQKKLNILKLKSKDLYLTVQKYYDSYSPAGHAKTKGIDGYLHKKYISLLRSGEYISSASRLRQGSISDPEGVPVGVDVNAEKPVYVDYSDNNLPPSTMVMATSGAGKTYLMQTILTGFLNNEDIYFPVVIDFKNEYVEFGESAGMQIISSSPVDGIYFDTMEIPAATGDIEIDARAKDASLSTTMNIFEILLGSAWEDVDGMQEAFSHVRRSLYRRKGVLLDDPSTWKNSRGLTFHSFYSEISRIIGEDRTQATEAIHQGVEVFLKMRDILSKYFERDGDKADYFKKPIRLDSINNRRGVIFALDRKREVSQGSRDEKLLLTMQYIMHILNALTDRKEDKRLIPIYYEETNQLLLLPKIASLISTLTTGGRSRGIRNFFITNSPKQIFKAENESKFSTVDPGLISTIISNARSVIVGPNSDEDMEIIKKQFNMESETLSAYTRLLVEQASEDNSDSSAMSHKFILRHRGKTTLIEAISNPALTRLGLFGTETKITKKSKKAEHDELLGELLNQQAGEGLSDSNLATSREKIYDQINNDKKKNSKENN